MHAKAPLTPEGRLRLCQRIEAGWTVAGAADSMGISRQTAHKWWRRYLEGGPDNLVDRSSRPRSCPRAMSPRDQRRLVELRRRRRVGPAQLAREAGVPISTLHRVLQRHGVSRLSDLDRSSGRVVRRIETSRPGEIVHVDVKKLAKIPPGGGWRTRGRGHEGYHAKSRVVGYAYVHSAIDAHTRLAYCEVHADERAATAHAVFLRALEFFRSYGIVVERVISDNGACYREKGFKAMLAERAIAHTHTRPYHPQTNGKIERFNRTLRDEWAYARPYRSEAARTRALDRWLHFYNHHRYHSAIRCSPAELVNNVCGQNT